ncbi:hypothetical protein HR15_05935 [Porphyromonas gulae]|uniref:Uncharacterized protein n=1 Tax=Porphyromonas gulae TaxID=111105 RepID=A0A0A2F9P4_9PORP|nr:hypothetical protein HR15_05935 [Porphyromonas gulae]
MGPVYNGSCTRRPIAAGTGTGTERIEIDCQYLVHTSAHVLAHNDRFTVREASQLRRLYSFVTNQPNTFRDNLLSPTLNDRNFLREEKIFCWRSNFIFFTNKISVLLQRNPTGQFYVETEKTRKIYSSLFIFCGKATKTPANVSPKAEKRKQTVRLDDAEV